MQSCSSARSWGTSLGGRSASARAHTRRLCDPCAPGKSPVQPPHRLAQDQQINATYSVVVLHLSRFWEIRMTRFLVCSSYSLCGPGGRYVKSPSSKISWRIPILVPIWPRSSVDPREPQHFNPPLARKRVVWTLWRNDLPRLLPTPHSNYPPSGFRAQSGSPTISRLARSRSSFDRPCTGNQSASRSPSSSRVYISVCAAAF